MTMRTCLVTSPRVRYVKVLMLWWRDRSLQSRQKWMQSWPRREPIKHKEAMSEADSHFGVYREGTPDVESVVQSDAMEKWIESHPSYARPALRAVIEGGTAAEVIELFDNFKEAQGTSKPAASQDVAVAAKAAIAKAKVAAPKSLSEIPAGAAVPTNSAEQMAEMSDRALMNMFEGKTPSRSMHY